MTLVAAVAAWRRFVREGGRRGPRADLYSACSSPCSPSIWPGLFENNWGDTEVQRPVLFVLALPFCLRGARERGATPAGQ